MGQGVHEWARNSYPRPSASSSPGNPPSRSKRSTSGDPEDRISPYGTYYDRAVACVLLSGRVNPKGDDDPNMTESGSIRSTNSSSTATVHPGSLHGLAHGGAPQGARGTRAVARPRRQAPRGRAEARRRSRRQVLQALVKPQDGEVLEQIRKHPKLKGYIEPGCPRLPPDQARIATRQFRPPVPGARLQGDGDLTARDGAYHRGQIARDPGRLHGSAVNTDFITSATSSRSERFEGASG